jgi:hypothetical protein
MLASDWRRSKRLKVSNWSNNNQWRHDDFGQGQQHGDQNWRHGGCGDGSDRSYGQNWRTIAWLNRNRRLAKDFEATIESAQAWLFIASVKLLSRGIART